MLSQNVDGRYLGYIEDIGISYIFAGENEIDVKLALYKLKNLIGIETLLLEGGRIINGAFLQADAINELSLVVAPIIADKDDKPLFMDSAIAGFTLIKTYFQNGALILNYKKT